MVRPRKNMLTVVEVRKPDGTCALRPIFIDVNKTEFRKTLINASDKNETIFNLDPEPEKPLKININIDQLEELEK